MAADRFFAFARERHAVYLRRAAGKPAPWSKDPILQRHRFTNVFRELDRTTIWAKKYVRDPLASHPAELLLAVVLFRWFNRIETGETLFCQPDLLEQEGVSYMTPFETFLGCIGSTRPSRKRDIREGLGALRRALKQQPAPHVTGSYTINTRGPGEGKSKVNGVLRLFGIFAARDWRTRAEQMSVPQFRHTLEGTCAWLQESTPCLGPFMAYEVACDLRWTPLLSHAGDVLTWANVGPGSQRGLNRLRGIEGYHEVNQRIPTDEALVQMRDLLHASRMPRNWPEEWPAWELREVEHTLCEFDKYERVRLGQGRPRGSFAP